MDGRLPLLPAPPRRGLIASVRRIAAFGAAHEDAEVRAPSFRVAVRTGTDVITDYGLVQRGVPFAHRMTRPQLTILVDGRARVEESGHSIELHPGDFLVSDGGAVRGARMAYGGGRLRQVLVAWDPAVLGCSHDRGMDGARLDPESVRRIEAAARAAVLGQDPQGALVDLFALLRSTGLPLRPPEVPAPEADPILRALYALLGERLSALHSSPAEEELAARLGYEARSVRRRLATLSETWDLPWTSWRSALHSQRVLDATRLLAAPRATTEAVARATGYRSPSALCHAFAEAGLPSPGTLTRAARHDALERWPELEAP